MTDMAKVLVDVMKPGLHGHMFCSAHRFSIWYMDLTLKERETGDRTKDYFSESGSERKVGKSEELQPAFQIDICALRYISTVGNYQHTTAAKRAA